jgi:sialate O-acetylesterase
MKYKLILVNLMCSMFSHANIILPPIIADHMVLRKAERTPVWGQANPGTAISVSLGDQRVETQADANGDWRVEMDLVGADPGPFEMTVASGQDTVVVHDVLVGEVWVASGQSNMAFTLSHSRNADHEMAQSNYPQIRMFHVKPYLATPTPREKVKGQWVVCSLETSGEGTAVGYHFARSLVQHLDVPVGLIHNAWGGTPIEGWMSYDALEHDPELKSGRDHALQSATEYPSQKEAYNRSFGKWLKQNHREDTFSENVENFVGQDVAITDWKSIEMPSAIFGDGVSDCGVVWLRGEVLVTPQMLQSNFPLRIGAMEAFPTVFWNGVEVRRDTYESYPGKGYSYRYYLGVDQLKVGKNILAIRFYAPSGNKTKVDVHCDFADFDDGLKIKEVTAFPSLTEYERATMPPFLPNPLRDQDVATYLFNGMIAPILSYGISGVIWYQGESNMSRAYQYRNAFPLLIQDWREKWQQGDLPFYFCQLPEYGLKDSRPKEAAWAELRESQASALHLPNTEMAVLLGLGEAKDVHPRNKKDAGERLALVALAKNYRQNVLYTGPRYHAMKAHGDKIELSFLHGEGLVALPVPTTYVLSSLTGATAPLVRNSPDSKLEGFAVCGKDREWVWADAEIKGDSVLVGSDEVAEPIAVRYNWANNPSGNLSNRSGLPAAPFRTDDFPAGTLGNRY